MKEAAFSYLKHFCKNTVTYCNKDPGTFNQQQKSHLLLLCDDDMIQVFTSCPRKTHLLSFLKVILCNLHFHITSPAHTLSTFIVSLSLQQRSKFPVLSFYTPTLLPCLTPLLNLLSYKLTTETSAKTCYTSTHAHTRMDTLSQRDSVPSSPP